MKRKIQSHYNMKNSHHFLKFSTCRKILIQAMTLCLMIFSFSPTVFAQEVGPLLMKQELGYTLGGGVAGAGAGVIIWFMDPLNPGITLKGSVTDGFITGTALGALFGFYMLQNALIFPRDSYLPENIDQLLGNQDNFPIHRSVVSKLESKSSYSINFPLLEFSF